MKEWCILATFLGSLWGCREIPDSSAAEPIDEGVQASVAEAEQHNALPPDTGPKSGPVPPDQAEIAPRPPPLRGFVQDTGTSAASEQAPIAVGEADRNQLIAAARAVEQIQSEVKARAASLLLFARVDGADSLIPVANPDNWPTATEVFYVLLPDSLGRARYLQEVPVSRSGDWHNTYTHYFAEDGRTLLFERYSGFLGLRCSKWVDIRLS